MPDKSVVVRGMDDWNNRLVIPSVCACCADEVAVEPDSDKPLLNRFLYCDSCTRHREGIPFGFLLIVFGVPVAIWKIFWSSSAPPILFAGPRWILIPVVAAAVGVLVSRIVNISRLRRRQRLGKCTALRHAVDVEILHPAEVRNRLRQSHDVVRERMWFATEQTFLEVKFKNPEVARRFAASNRDRALVAYSDMDLPPLPPEFRT